MAEEQQQQPYGESISEEYSLADTRDTDLTRWQLSLEETIEEFKHDLKGEIYDEKAGDWVKPAGNKPLMNDKGINELIAVLRKRVSKNTILSNLKEDDIIMMVRNVDMNLTQIIFNNWEAFAINKEDLSMISDICDSITETIYCAYMRASQEGERKFLGKSQRTFERVIQAPQEKRGWWPFGK